MKTTRSKPVTDSIEDAAARWLFRCSEILTPAEKAEFEAWRSADERHREAFARLESDWVVLDRPLMRGRTDELVQHLRARASRRQRRRVSIAAACLTLVGLGGVWRPWQGDVADAQTTRVAVVAPAKQTLPDGSIVELKPGADITVDFSGPTRGVVLVRGAAHFQVAHDRRPFVVSVGGVGFRAVGTAFSVGMEDVRVELLVTEGRVAVEQRSGKNPIVSPTASLATVDAGNRLTVSLAPEPGAPLPAPTAVAADDVAEELSWRIPRLDFSRTPLSDAVALMNQYGRAQMFIEDHNLASLPVSGLFRADRVEAFVRLLEANFDVEAKTSGETIRLRRRR